MRAQKQATNQGTVEAEEIEHFLDHALSFLRPVFEEVAANDAAKSKGYEPYFISRGGHPAVARLLARLLVRRGNRVAAENPRVTPVMDALRYLTQPRRKRPLLQARLVLLLRAWEETSIIEAVFKKAGTSEFEFVGLLKEVINGRDDRLPQLRSIAQSLLPHLQNARGPKVRAASAAHEFFLEHESSRYTRDVHTGDFTDPLTRATRLEFADRNFSPAAAAERLKRSKLLP